MLVPSHIAPQFVGERFDLRVALWKMFEARRMPRFAAHHRQAGADESADAPQQFWCHIHFILRQHQNRIRGAAGQGQPAVSHPGPMQQDVRIDGVVLVAGRQGRIEVGHFGRRVFAAKIGRVGDVAALLQQKLAPRHVIQPRFALFPPSERALKVEAPGTHRHPGPAVGPRLHGVAVKNVAVQARAIHQIAQRLERPRILAPARCLRCRRERFGPDDRFAIDVRDRRGQFHRRISLRCRPKTLPSPRPRSVRIAETQTAPCTARTRPSTRI